MKVLCQLNTCEENYNPYLAMAGGGNLVLRAGSVPFMVSPSHGAEGLAG